MLNSDKFTRDAESGIYRKTPEYCAWVQARARCTNPLHKSYKDYGGRGITFSECWGTFEAFLSEMGPRPAGCTLERTNVNKGYGPGNCVWADWDTQANNRRNNRPIEYLGKTQNLLQWSRETGISVDKLKYRLDAGLPLTEVFASPNRPRGRNGMACATRKLNAAEALEIRAHERQGVTLAALGKIYGVSPASIHNILKRKTWASI